MSAKLRNKKLYSLMLLLSVMLTMLCSSLMVFADSKANATADELAKRELTGYVWGQMSQNEYAVDGGGTLAGSDLFEGSPTDGYDLKASEFNTLTDRAQTQVVEDIAENSYQAMEECDNVSESTVQNWWKELQVKDGVGSKFLNEILKNTKPDFVTANKIYQPFSGLVGTIMGCIAVIGMGFLGIVLAADIFYIVLPPVRMLVSESDEQGKLNRSKIFSHDAIYAVECSENNSDGGSGGGKQALGIYLKRRVVALILLGICLMYLVNGQLYTAVSWILSLVKGFLGF